MKKLRITIGNKSYDVTVEDLTEADSLSDVRPTAAAASTDAGRTGAAGRQPPRRPSRQLPVEPGAVTSPMAGAIKSILVKAGDQRHSRDSRWSFWKR